MASSDRDESPETNRRSRALSRSREVIRKQLATATNEVDHHHQEGKNLLICFMNEALLEEDQDGDQNGDTSIEYWSAQFIAKNNISRKKNHVIVPLTPNGINRSILESPRINEDEDEGPEDSIEKRFAVYLSKIRSEAREKLKKAKQDAKEAMNTEKREDQRSVVKDLDQLFGVKRSCRKLTRQVLTGMNIGQLQVILNYLLSRIEELNEKLVQDLIVRDELVMEQDSILTDIEDITKGINVEQ